MENGPLKMYHARQIVEHNFSVELPMCMYKMKNIHDDTTRRKIGNVIKTANHVSNDPLILDISEQVKQFLKNQQYTPGMTELMQRQQKILQQLENLKKQMLNIRKELNVTNVPQQVCSILNKKVAFSQLDLIVNVSPSNPPHSLNILARLLKDKITIKVMDHVHSSIKDTQKLSFEMPTFTSTKANLPMINVRLIWKDVGVHLEMITSNGSHIFGEVNMLRYIARKLNYLNYENLNDYEIDSILDTCHCVLSASTKTERAALLRLLNRKFDEKWQLSLPDVALYSVMKQIAKNELSANLVKLLNHLENL